MSSRLNSIILLGALLLIFSLQEKATAEEAKAKYPMVSEVSGSVLNLKDPAKPVKVQKKDVLTEHAVLKVGPKSGLRLELDPGTVLMLQENSELEIPVITWGEGEVTDLVLARGKMRVDCQKDCTRVVATPLSKSTFVNGEYILHYSPESPFVELTVLHGAQEFRGLENEETVKVEPGQKVVFQGLKENEDVAYDVLLKGRKVARGKLQPLVKLESEALAALEKVTQVQKPVVVKKKIVPRKPSQICTEPYGELNQCAWLCQGRSPRMKLCDLSKKGVSCVRKRCNANGEWQDPQVMPQAESRCQVEPQVGNCDY